MKHTHIPKLLIGLSVLFAALLMIGDHQTAIGQSSSSDETTPAVEKYLTGFAWSSNIGWISLRGSLYGVELSPSGELSGYGWASNLGWISFNRGDLSSCPSGNGPCAATIDAATGKVDGWARACSGTVSKDCKGQDRTDGWEGWIHFSGTNHESPNASGNGGLTYFPSTGDLNGFAWGSDVVGWIDFSGVRIVNSQPIIVEQDINNEDTEPPVITKFRMSPNTVNRNQSCTMLWEVENADTCTIIGQGYTEDYDVVLPTGSDKTAPITASSRYTLRCSNSAGAVTKDAICRINVTLNEN